MTPEQIHRRRNELFRSIRGYREEIEMLQDAVAFDEREIAELDAQLGPAWQEYMNEWNAMGAAR